MKKVLVIFEEESKKNILIDSALFFKDKFGYEIVPLYIKDIRREEIIPATMDGMILNFNNDPFSEEANSLEEMKMKKIQEKIKDKGIDSTLNVESGFPWDIIKEYMKTTDLLILEKRLTLSDTALMILKNHFKPIIMIGEKAITSFDKIGISSDDGTKIHKSMFSFINIFPEINYFSMFTLRYKIEKNLLMKYLEDKEKKIKYENFDGDIAKDRYLQEVNKLDLLIMGNLNSNYFVEKIIGKKGLSIMEKSKVSIFIG
ncbi:MAG: hypothetical protein ACRC5W_07080 [Cetobacterium sp.]|uniref:hypothetical protein n=1 Tax=Cetobacterium sp. TaxID=2071632 RepID=UPI003F3E56BF